MEVVGERCRRLGRGLPFSCCPLLAFCGRLTAVTHFRVPMVGALFLSYRASLANASAASGELGAGAIPEVAVLAHGQAAWMARCRPAFSYSFLPMKLRGSRPHSGALALNCATLTPQ